MEAWSRLNPTDLSVNALAISVIIETHPTCGGWRCEQCRHAADEDIRVVEGEARRVVEKAEGTCGCADRNPLNVRAWNNCVGGRTVVHLLI
jgi:hypothetical protein